jgi:hypothetical protein
MFTHLVKTFTLAAFIACLSLPAAAQYSKPADPNLPAITQGIWKDVSADSASSAGRRTAVPQSYRVISLDTVAFDNVFSRAPMVGTAAAQTNPLVVSVPLPDGTTGRFAVYETQIMAPELAAKFPEIKTWSGQGLDEPAATIHIDKTLQGSHAMVLSPTTGRVFIDPYSNADNTTHISYFAKDLRRAPGVPGFNELPPVGIPNGARALEMRKLMQANQGLQRTTGTQLRTYRLAVAATGEYTAFHGGTVPLGQAAIVTAVNRVSGIYQAEIAIKLQLVGNNSSLVYTNRDTDPFTDSDAYALIDEVQSVIDSVIGSANYDVGHVFSTGGGGLAQLGVPCQSGFKAQGITGSSAPTGDAFWVDYVAHEMGHQLGGNHTFNSPTGACSGNRSSTTAYEPGSGSTIMAYAGICGADDLQLNSDPYFHSVSFDEIVTYTTIGAGATCGTVTATGNSPPTVTVPTGGFTIPKQTPFALTGSAVDPQSDALTYSWEEYDLGPSITLSATTPSAPFFRSWSATTSPTRTIPRLPNLLSNVQSSAERLPTGSATLTFRLTARDNRATGGGVAYNTISFSVTNAAGPFLVSAPDTSVSWQGGSSQTVAWNVANTNLAPVSCPNVAISLSTDGGNTFPTVLAASAPNNGSSSITVPNTPTSTARIKVACANSIFFDISNTNFTITAGISAPSAPTISGITTGPGSAIISFTAPVSNGGATIVSYTATCTASGQTTRTVTGASSPLTVTGLASGVAYSCSVTAYNGTSTSAASSAQSVTSSRSVDLTPILMLLLD